MSELDAIRARISYAVARAKRAGWTIRPMNFFSQLGGYRYHCCPLGAVLLAHGGGPQTYRPMGSAAALLGVSAAWAACFMAGFDDSCWDAGSYPEACNTKAYRLGKAYRERFVGGGVQP